MTNPNYFQENFDRKDPLSIFHYSRLLIGNSLHGLIGESVTTHNRSGKGGLGQMVEELFFKYDINSNREADFKEAQVELKCTPLIKKDGHSSYKIKERLVCTMIDYSELVKTKFEDSHLLAKCRLMLLLFYQHIKGYAPYDLEFIFRILWQLPEKDLLLIKKDYDTIADKVRRGEAHLLSEGDTVYLGACRKGQKGDTPQKQPFSEIAAYKRAFSLKPAYMRYVLSHVVSSGKNSYTNYTVTEKPSFELVSENELKTKSFEEILLNRFNPFIGKNYIEICQLLGMEPYQSKNKYADIAALIASDNKSKRLEKAEEFIKSGITMKTVRLRPKGAPKESMSFKNIDYFEIFENDEWTNSETYELFTTRFLFVVFKPVKNSEIQIINNSTKRLETEQSYILDRVFFWTMPPEDLEVAKEYWNDIRQNVLDNNINLSSFWNIAKHRKFHVRPKATKTTQKAPNPNGGFCNKYCYWFNAEYVKSIIENTEL